MKDHAVTGLALIVLFVGGGVGLTLVPSLQDAQLTVDTDASRGVEQARRLLSQFNANLERIAQLAEDLRILGIDIDRPEGDDRLGSDEFLAIFEDERDAQTGEFGAKDEHRPRGAPAAQIRDGLGERRKLIAANDELLADALAAVEGALLVQHGAADASDDCGGNRLKGLILFYQGESAARRAAQARSRTIPVRERISASGVRVASLEPDTRLVADSGIDQKTAALTKELQDRVATANAFRDELAAVDKRIGALEGELTTAQASAASARATMEQLQADGVDFGDAQGFERFTASYQTAAAQYRTAQNDVHAIEHGTLPHAEIDASGDYINGLYLENGSPDNLTSVNGLTHYRAERERLAAAVRMADQSVTDLGVDLGRFKETRRVYEQRQSEAAQEISDARTQGQAASERLAQIDVEVETLENEALSGYVEAAKAFERAERAVDDWVSEAGESLRNLSPETKSLSAYQPRLDDGWIGAHIATERAAAEAGLAWVYYQRFTARTRNAELWSETAEPLALAGADADQDRSAADEARENGIDAAKQAVERLQRAHRDLGRDWTVTAQHAGTAYLLVLFGNQGHLNDVIENYRNAIAGREDEVYARPLKERLDILENR